MRYHLCAHCKGSMTGGERRCQVSDLSDSVEFLGQNAVLIPGSPECISGRLLGVSPILLIYHRLARVPIVRTAIFGRYAIQSMGGS
jgi:hypothetical protein